MTRILHDPAEAGAMLAAGKLVAIPTETVYGLGADALREDTVAAVFEAKQRPHFDPLIVHVANRAAASVLVRSFPDEAELLASAFWPGPLTLVLPKSDQVPDIVTSGLPAVGIRVPAHPLTLEVLRSAACPIAAPSANLFGSISPTTCAHVLQGLDGRIDAVLDGGPCRIGVESTVVSFASDVPVILRPGGLSAEQIREIIPEVRIRSEEDPEDLQTAGPPGTSSRAWQSPGLTGRHYAPATKLILFGESDALPPVSAGTSTALLTWGNRDTEAAQHGYGPVMNLSRDGDLTEAATGFFKALRELDDSGCAMIAARCFPDRGLGVALNNRLQRAAIRESGRS